VNGSCVSRIAKVTGTTRLEARGVLRLDLEAEEERIGAKERGHQVAGAHVLPGLHRARLNRALHRGAHVRVAQVDLGHLEGLAGDRGVCLRGQGLGLVGVQLFAGDEGPGCLIARPLPPGDHRLGVFLGGDRFVEPGPGAVHRQLEPLRVDDDEDVPLLDVPGRR